MSSGGGGSNQQPCAMESVTEFWARIQAKIDAERLCLYQKKVRLCRLTEEQGVLFLGGFRVHRTGGELYEQAPRTSNDAVGGIPAFFDGNPIVQALDGRRTGSDAVLVVPSAGTLMCHGIHVPRVRARHYADTIWFGAHPPSSIGRRGGQIIIDIEEDSRSLGQLYAEACPGFTVVGQGGGALGVRQNNYTLTTLVATARAMSGSTQALLVHEAGGRFPPAHIHRQLQTDRDLEAAIIGAEDGPSDLSQRALQSAFGGLVPLCCTLLLDDKILNGAFPGYIKVATCAGLGIVTGFTYLGILSKKRAKAALRLVASTAMAAVSTALVYNVSDNVYIKCTCGIIGAVATVATMAIR